MYMCGDEKTGSVPLESCDAQSDDAQLDIPRLVLASQSPRRRELLARAGASFCCLVPNVDEDVDSAVDAEHAAVEVASRKAHAAANMLSGNLGPCAVVACDTMVVVGGIADGAEEQILGKPADADDARRMLRMLSGTAHRVASGVCILSGVADGSDLNEVSFAETTRVTFKQLDDEQIDTYISTGEPFDKAGAYGIQGAAGAFVENVDGDYDNVVGLPLSRTLEALSKIQASAASIVPALSEKAAVRSQMKAIRQSISPADRAAASEQACRHIMATPEFQNAKVVAAFCAFGSELCFDYMATHLPQGKTFAVPITMPDHRMEFVAIDPLQILPGNRTLPFLSDPAGIASIPSDAEVLEASQVDLMLVPGLAFDEHGFRIGYGGGYYDVYMNREGFHAACYGTFFEQQHCFGCVPRDPHDMSLHAVATQQGIRRFA